MKICSKCRKSKPFSNFSYYKRSADGYAVWCKSCHSEASRAHYLANKEARNEAARAWAKANPDKARKARIEFHGRNKAERAAQHKEWAQKNRGMRNATSMKHHAAKKRAIPKWANIEEIKRIYRMAAAIQKISGIRMHVDHIVPLQSDLVCGLHCEANLAILPGAENEAKKNYWWPDMPRIEQAVAQGQLFAHEPAPLPVQESLL